MLDYIAKANDLIIYLAKENIKLSYVLQEKLDSLYISNYASLLIFTVLISIIIFIIFLLKKCWSLISSIKFKYKLIVYL